MTIIELITHLTEIKDNYGNLECVKYVGWDVSYLNEQNKPCVKEIAVNTKRESKIRFKESYDDREVLKKVCKL